MNWFRFFFGTPGRFVFWTIVAVLVVAFFVQNRAAVMGLIWTGLLIWLLFALMQGAAHQMFGGRRGRRRR